MQEEYLYPLPDGETLQVSYFKNQGPDFGRCIIFAHGFKGFKDWGFFPYSAEYFAEKGFDVISFNFSHNGIGQNKLEMSEVEKFSKNTVSREVYELSSLIDGIRSGFFGDKLRTSKLGLIGHSRGGAVVISVSNLQRKEISAYAVWASVAKLNRYTDRQKEEWRKAGFFEVVNTRTGQVLRLNVSLLEDIENNSAGLLNLEKNCRELNAPFFIAHGGQDLTVPVDEANLLYEWSDKEKTELYILPTAGHTFDVVHPFEGSNEKLERLLENTLKFFVKHLNSNK